MKALVTGASGFVGTALCAELLARGHAIRAAVRRPTPLGAGLDAVIVADAGPEADWSAGLRGIDVVFHLAAHVHARSDDSRRVNAINVDGTRALAEQAARAGVRRMVFVSSIKVLGDEGVVTDRSAPAPAGPYAASKLAAERALRTIEKETGLEVVVVRPPLVYGPGVKANFLALLSVVARRWPLPLGSVQNRRSLVFVGNLVDALVAAAAHPAAPGLTFLVTDGDDRSTPDLIRAVAASLGVRSRLVPCPPSWLVFAARGTGRSEMMHRLVATLVGEMSAAGAGLQWRPRFTVEAGLALTAAWYRTRARL